MMMNECDFGLLLMCFVCSQNGDVMLRRWLYEWVRCGVGLGSRGMGMENGFFGVSKMPTVLE